jgi:probable HAF family extracellular repeat protein
MKDLNKLIPTGSGWVLTEADGINASGQIIGMGTHSGQEHAFLLTPQ